MAKAPHFRAAHRQGARTTWTPERAIWTQLAEKRPWKPARSGPSLACPIDLLKERPSTPTDEPLSPLVVLGAGLIGTGWIALCLAAGLEVRVFDPDPATLESLRTRLRPLRRYLAKLRKPKRGKLVIARKLEQAAAGARLIQENAPEKLDLKRQLFTQIEAAAPADAVIATSTTALLWSDLAVGMQHPERLLIAHPFNPVHLIPLVELYTPDDALAARAAAFYARLGKHPVRLAREMPGHIAGRLSAALWREAVHLVAEGVASVEAVDAALTQGPGVRWAVQGAHLGYHMGGGPGGMAHYLAHLGPSQEHRWQTLGTPTLDAQPRQRLIDGITEATGNAPVSELESQRDAALVKLLRARR